MCGFICYLSKTDHSPPEDKVKMASESLRHRGTNTNLHFNSGKVYMIFNKLATTDTAKNERAISFSNNRYIIAFDGKVYNTLELKDKLKLPKLNTDSVNEILIALYHELGEQMIYQLRGIFAFVIWDKVRQRLFGARDHFGVKPLHYLENDQQLIISSEQKGLLPFSITSINTVTLQHYLTFQYPPEPFSMHKQIKKIPKGSYFNYELLSNDIFTNTLNNITISNYFKPLFSPKKSSPQKEKELCNKIRTTLQNSVALHMGDNSKTGAFLSSGLDSTILVSAAKKLDSELNTFSIGFHEQEYDESKLAEEIAQELGTIHHTKTVTAEEIMDDLPKIIWHLDDPIADPAAIPLYYLSKTASQSVDTVLSGEGADELFGGYNIYREPLDLNIFKIFPRSINPMLLYLANILPENIKGKDFLRRGLQTIETRYYGNARIFRQEEKPHIYKKYHKNSHHSDITLPYYCESENLHEIEKMQYIDLNTWLPGDILVKADRMTMANGLKLRVPFLDKEVFNLAKVIPWNLKITNKTTKYILRKAFEGEIPRSVVYRKKLGFPVPIRPWLRNSMYAWAEEIIESSNTDYLFNKKELLKLLSLHKKANKDYSRKIWAVITFMIWHKMYVET